MKRSRINDIIDDIMVKDGPDGHCDGSGLITSFIISYKRGKGEEWYKNYCTPDPDKPDKPLSKESSVKFDKLLAKRDKKKK